MTWKIQPSWVWTNGIKKTDPVQGNTGNCALMAVLASLAWMKERGKSYGNFIYLTPPTSGDYTIIRFYASVGSAPTSKEVTKHLPLDGSDQFIYARSSDVNEIWPALYEKAYARFQIDKDPDLSQSYPTNPETVWADPAKEYKDTPKPSVPWGFGGSALAHLTGKTYYPLQTSGKTGTQVYTEIKSKCDSGTGIANYPLVAWTHTTATSDFPYDTLNIVAKHTYSVLGVITNQEYIVLRNPYGKETHPIDGEYAGTEWAGITFSNNDGIFALSAEKFQKAFETWCYVR